MKQWIVFLLAVVCLLLCAGCGSAFERDYYYEAAYSGDFGNVSDYAAEIRNYSMLKTAVTGMISRHEEQGEFRLSNYNGNPSEDLAAACYEIKSANPLGAFAVESLSYDTSYVVSYYVANIYISYKRTAEEIAGITYVGTPEELDTLLGQRLYDFSEGSVVRIYSAQVNEAAIVDMVRRHYYDDPVPLVMEPEVTVESYPAEGANRVYDIHFRFGLSQPQTVPLSAVLGNRLDAMASSMTETEKPALALEAAERLSTLCSSGEGEYSATAYGAVVEQTADSKGFAVAYRALCRRLDIPCLVVEGSVGAMGTQPHFWNIITLEDECYHVDVSAMAEDPAAAFLLSDDALWGTYIWETERYPACSGTLRYADVAELPELQIETEEEALPTEEAPEPSDEETPEEKIGE